MNCFYKIYFLLRVFELSVNLVLMFKSDSLVGQAYLLSEVIKAISQKTIQKVSTSSCQDLAASMTQVKQDPNRLKAQPTARFIQKLRLAPS